MEKVRETLKLPCQNICISLPFAAVDVSRGGTSATQRQKFHTDDVKSVRKPVRSAELSTEKLDCFCHCLRMTGKRQKATKVKGRREESLTKQSIFVEYSVFQNKHLSFAKVRWQMNTILYQNRPEDSQNWTNLYLEPHDYLIYYVIADLRHQCGISVAESQTFFRVKRQQRRRARRNGCFRRLHRSHQVSVERKAQNSHARTLQRIFSGKGRRNQRSSRFVSNLDMLNAGFNFSVTVLQLQDKVCQATHAIYGFVFILSRDGQKHNAICATH